MTWLSPTAADLLPAGLHRSDDLATLRGAVLVSLFSDRALDPSETSEDGDRRGWWADAYAEPEGDRIGSGLWRVLERGRWRAGLVGDVERYAAEALAWLTEDGIASAVSVEAGRSGELLWLAVEIVRFQGPPLRLRWRDLWASAVEG